MFKYFGSKYRSSKYYPAPRYPLIIEPFAGGAGYSSRYREHNVLLADIDREVIDLWQWLIAADPNEIAAMPVTGLVTGQDIRTLGLSKGASELMRRWQRTGRGSAWTISNITTGDSAWCRAHGCGQDGGNTGMWHRNTRDYLVSAVQEIRHWSALCCPYWEVPRIEATWFIDPPYQHVKCSSYKHGLKDIDYQPLAAWCRALPGQVIVCEQQGADWLPFVYSHEVSGIREKMCGVPGAKSQEVVWCNDALPAPAKEHVEILTVDELFAFLTGVPYFTQLEPPTALPAAGVWIWPSPSPERHGADALLFDCAPAIYISAAPDVWAALKELETRGGVC
jgi:hypothetical protein